MLWPLTLILTCQLAGEMIVNALGLPIPGPVCGMALLLVGLLIKGETPAALDTTAGTLLSNLSLLFVPAGVGVILHLPLIGQEWLPISASLIGGTLITIAVTALIMNRLAPAEGEQE